MAIDIRSMFYSRQYGREGGGDWNRELFQRAYFTGDGPFSRAIRRVSAGFSVLAYLPGNCMGSAAGVVRAEVSGCQWSEFLEHPSAGETLEDAWKATPGIVSALKAWFQGEGDDRRPGGIFHNLDFLSDGHGGGYGHPYAQTGVSGLVAGSRAGVVFGMSDRDEPELPTAISRAFSETIRLDEIPFENFYRIMPVELGEKLQQWGLLSDGTVWMMAARLRWLDPIRASRTRRDAAPAASSLDDVFAEILKATQTVDFLPPDEAYPSEEDPDGFEPDTLETVRRAIVRPFQQWRTFQGDADRCRKALLKLPPGAVYFGPPGTGKTTLARWTARKTGLPVRTVSGGEIRSAGWGEAEKNVRALFRDARRAAPCVLILDDADDLLPSRNAANEGSTASAERAVVNEFLQQLQGFRGRLEGVLVILTTNRFSSVDPAAAGRLPLHLAVPYPQTREQVGEILDSIARDFDYVLMPEVRQKLIERFYLPVHHRGAGDRNSRDGLFSPREIQSAMRMLSGEAELGAAYHPHMADVERMKEYYQKLPQVQALK